MQNSPLIKLHSVIRSSVVNGPGKRMVVFFQGCKRDCPGCFNTKLRPTSGSGFEINSAKELFAKHETPDIEGLTVSGGEPFDQPEALCALVQMAKGSYALSTVVYTGNRHEELMKSKKTRECLAYIDVLIDGPFDEKRPETTMLARGSTNQRIILLTDRYKKEDFLLAGKVEIIISPDGTITSTGFSEAAIGEIIKNAV